MVDNETFFYIRRTRARPPGRAADDERRQTYGTALEQFEELIGAAATASPGVRPLPLFYALSQAGRAITAAYLLEGWKPGAHGLSCQDLSPASVLDVDVRIWKPDPTRPDSFNAVSQAVGSETPSEPVKLGALWAALPEVGRLIADARETEQWPDALLVLPHEDVMSPLWDASRVNASLISSRHPMGVTLADALDVYPYSDVVRAKQINDGSTVATHTSSGLALDVSWPSEEANLTGRHNTLDRIVPTAPGGDRWWRPRVGGAGMSDLMLWWVLLFGLSMLARYEPAGWNAMLDLDGNELAAHLVRLMDAVVDVVPWLVLQVLEPDYVAAVS
jgi:hypothetical protein